MNGIEDLFAGHPAVPTDLPLPPGKLHVSAESITKTVEATMEPRMPQAALLCLGLLIVGLAGGLYRWSPQAWIAGGVSFVPIAGAGLLYALSRKKGIPARWAHPAATLLAGFVTLQYAFLAHLTGNAFYAGAVLVLIMGSAFFFLSLPWFLTTLLISAAPAFAVLHSLGTIAGPGAAISAGLYIPFALVIQNSRLKDARWLVQYQLEERKRIEILSSAISEARGSEKRFRKLSEAGREALILHTGGKIVDLNKAAVTLMGYAHAELIGKPVASLVTATDRHFVEQITDPANENLSCVTALRKNGLPVKLAAFNHVLISPEETVAVLGLRPLSAIPTEFAWMPSSDSTRASASLRAN